MSQCFFVQQEDFQIKNIAQITRRPYAQYTFDVAKCCGYSEFVDVYKDAPTSHLYMSVCWQFENPNVTSIYLINELRKEKFLIPYSNDITIRQLYNQHANFMKPIYDMPFPIVYKLYYDDGHSHGDHTHVNGYADYVSL